MAADAAAHAYPITTSPAIGGVVKASPKVVSITYDEAVTVPSLAVYDAAGKVVSSSTVAHPAPDEIDVAIGGRLPEGTYTVAWRVTSADTHIVHGVYRFSVGKRGSAGGIGAKLLSQQQVPEGLALGFGVVRFLNLALLLLCAGGAIMLCWVLRDADERVGKALLRTLTIAAALLALVAVVGLPFQAAEANGTGLGGGFARTALEAVRHQRFGELWLVRAWMAVVFGLLALSLQLWERRQLGRRLLLAVVGVCLLLTSADSGHASVSGTLAFVADGVHITGAAIWLGGLAFVIAAIVLSRAENRWALAAVSVPRFSLMAMIAIPLLGAAGIVSAYLEVRVWRGLWETTYGVLILVKIAIALPLLALGAFNNRVSVPALRAGAASPATPTRFLRAVGTELALLLAVLAVTAALIDEAPAKGVLSTTTPQPTALTAHGSAGPFRTTVTLRPALAGTNTVDMRVTSARHLTIGEVDLAAVSPGGKLKPVNLNVAQLSATRFRVAKATLRPPGRWELEMTVRHGLTEWLARIPVTIGQGRR
jgi:copper transport protein